MRKVIAGINMTLDGIFDHTAISPDEELHRHYTDLLKDAGVVLYGRITYQLMEYWKPFVASPSGQQSMDEFAVAMDRIPKIVFSNTFKEVDWQSARLAQQDPVEVVRALKAQPGKFILLGSRSIIIQLLQHNLVDELQLCVHPVIKGEGHYLFDRIQTQQLAGLKKVKALSSGAVILYYDFQKANNNDGKSITQAG